MDGDGGYHPNVRKDFPGGWKDDKMNAFMPTGRTDAQNEMFEYMKALLNWRKTQPVIHAGKLTHYIPEDNIYVYFRHDERKAIMVILNANAEKKTLATTRFSSNLKSFSAGKDVVTGKEYNSLSTFELGAGEALIIDLK